MKASCSSNLRILEANSCGISQDGAEFLQQALSQKSSLRSISLRDNCILDEGVSYIGEGLLAGPDLEELDLGKNQVRICPNPFFCPLICILSHKLKRNL